MARRNLFQPPPPPESADPAPEQKSRFPNTGAMSGVKSTLKDLTSNAIRDIPVSAIEEDGPRDRLSYSDDAIADLAQSIKDHGQQVPIMVRPVPERPGHYRVVYGRRRLCALRVLGLPAKALVRSLSDQEAVLAQGQENSHRLDPSFIEKALFVAQLAEDGFDAALILDALAIDKPMLSRMAKVAREIPAEVIRAIGPAHGIGRRRWEDLADRVRAHPGDLTDLVAGLDLGAVDGSEQRFAMVLAAVTPRAEPVRPPALPIAAQDGTVLAELADSPRTVTLRLSKSTAPDFADWMRDNAEAELRRLYAQWQSDTE